MQVFAMKRQAPMNDGQDVPAGVTLAAVAPECAEMIAKLDELEQRRKDLVAEARKIGKLMPREPKEEAVSAHERQVAQMLGEVVVPLRPPRPQPDLQERLFIVLSEIRAIDEAMEILRGRYAETARRASRAICKRLQPENARRVAAICKCLAAFNSLQLEYLNFTERLAREGVTLTVELGVMHPDFAQHPTDQGSRIGYYLREAVERGFIAASDVPVHLRGVA